MMAIPFSIPRFFPHWRETVGVIQVYYQEEDRSFPPLDVQMAELLARRLTFVIGRKKILSLYRANRKRRPSFRRSFRNWVPGEGSR